MNLKLLTVFFVAVFFLFHVRAEAQVTAISCAEADIQTDGIVNILDVATVARYYGEAVSGDRDVARADFDKSGLIDILDLILVAQRFGEECRAAAAPDSLPVSGSGVFSSTGICQGARVTQINPYDFDNTKTITASDLTFLSQFFEMGAEAAQATGKILTGKVVDIDGDYRVDIADVVAMSMCLPVRTNVPSNVCAMEGIDSVRRALGQAYYDYNEDGRVDLFDVKHLKTFFDKNISDIFSDLRGGKIYDSNDDGKIALEDAIRVSKCEPPTIFETGRVTVDHDEMKYGRVPTPDSVVITKVAFLSNEFGDVGSFSRKPKPGQQVVISVSIKNERKVPDSVSGISYKVYKGMVTYYRDKSLNTVRTLESEGRAEGNYVLNPQETRIIDFTTSFREAGDYSIDILLLGKDMSVTFPVQVVGISAATPRSAPVSVGKPSFFAALLDVVWVLGR